MLSRSYSRLVRLRDGIFELDLRASLLGDNDSYDKRLYETLTIGKFLTQGRPPDLIRLSASLHLSNPTVSTGPDMTAAARPQ